MKLTAYLGRIIVLSVSNELGVIVVVWKDSKIVELDIDNEVCPALKWVHGRGARRLVGGWGSLHMILAISFPDGCTVCNLRQGTGKHRLQWTRMVERSLKNIHGGRGSPPPYRNVQTWVSAKFCSIYGSCKSDVTLFLNKVSG